MSNQEVRERPRLGLLALTVVAAGIAIAAPVAVARGGGFVEVRLADGTLAMQAQQAPLRYPASGALIRVRDAKISSGTLELRNVSILGGRIRAGRLVIPRSGFANAEVEDLVIDGQSLAAVPNEVFSLGTLGYVIVLQQAVLPGKDSAARGLVGLRVYLAGAVAGLRPGAQLLVGLPGAAVRDRRGRAQAPNVIAAAPSNATASWRTLGFTETPPAPVATAPSAPWAAPTTAFSFPAAVPSLNGIGAQAAALAQVYLGVPYVWAGADPSGFDCSGLTMFIYRQLGVSLTHFTGNQWYEGRRIPISELRAGDLVFFEPRSYGPGHEGIYIGGGQFIHAPHTGDVVKISSLSGYYSSSYVGARRV